jgi:hypothetical protein
MRLRLYELTLTGRGCVSLDVGPHDGRLELHLLHVLQSSVPQEGLCVASLSSFMALTLWGNRRKVTLICGPFTLELLSRWQTARSAISPMPWAAQSGGTMIEPF